MAHFPPRNILLRAPPSPSPSSPSPSLLPLPPHAKKIIDPLCPGSRVSSVRIIPPGIGFPLLPCSWEPRSCPFLIRSASTSQWHWAPQQPLCVSFFFFLFSRSRQEMERMQSKGPMVMILSLSPADSLLKSSK